MKSNRKLVFDAKQVKKQKPKLKDENQSLVTDNRAEKVVILYYHINNYFHRIQRINIDFI